MNYLIVGAVVLWCGSGFACWALATRRHDLTQWRSGQMQIGWIEHILIWMPVTTLLGPLSWLVKAKV